MSILKYCYGMLVILGIMIMGYLLINLLIKYIINKKEVKKNNYTFSPKDKFFIMHEDDVIEMELFMDYKYNKLDLIDSIQNEIDVMESELCNKLCHKYNIPYISIERKFLPLAKVPRNRK